MLRYVVLGALLSLFVGLGLETSRAAEPAGPYVVKVHADWCGTCTRLNPIWEVLREKYADRAQFVVLDVTDRDAVAAASEEAERLGLASFFAEYKARTGVVGIFDGSTKQLVEIFKGEWRVEAYDDVLEELVASS